MQLLSTNGESLPLIDHALPERWQRPPTATFQAPQFTPNFLATTMYNVNWVSTAHSHNNRVRRRLTHRYGKRPREDDGADDFFRVRIRGYLRKANPKDMERLHNEVCPRCFPIFSATTPEVRQLYQQLIDEGLWQSDPTRKEFWLGLFQCAMLRGHKDCMLEMHKRGIGGEYAPFAGSVYAPNLAVMLSAYPDMLRLLYQMGHDFRDVVLDSNLEDDDIADALQFAVQMGGAQLTVLLMTYLFENSKLHMFTQSFDRTSWTQARSAAFDELSGVDRNGSGSITRDLLAFRVWSDDADLCHRLLETFPGYNDEEILSWLRMPPTSPSSLWRGYPMIGASVHRYLLARLGECPGTVALAGPARHDLFGNHLASIVSLDLV